MKEVFSPHPNWRRNFEFTAAYTKKDSTYTATAIVNSKPIVEFKVDPILHKFTWLPAQVL